MKITAKAMESFLARPDGQCRAALVYGPNAGLVRERTQRIRQAVMAGNDDPFAYVELEETTVLDDPARLVDELSSISLMGGKRLVLVRDAGDKLTRVLESAAEAFNDGAFLLVAADELASRSSLRAFFEKEPACAAIACYRDEARDVQAAVRKTFAEAGITADSDVVQYLSEQLGNDRFVTYQELEKIILFAGDSKTITLKEAEALVDYNRDTGLDDVVTALADKNLQALEQMIGVQVREGTQPIAYLRAASRYFNRLYAIRAQMQTGRSAADVIQGLRPPVFFKQVPIMTRHAEAWDTPQIVKALKLLTEAELSCKSSDLPPLPASHRKLMQLTQVR
jgi:DNA polymerase III subunit delta